jgi:hypothetical protein
MMKDRIEITYDQLPADLKNLISESKFLTAYTTDQGKKIIIWFLDDATGRKKEMEFSIPDRRILSRAEREKDLPAQEEMCSIDPRFKVIRSHELEPGTDTLHERYEVYDKATNKKIAEQSRNYFTSFLSNADEFARSVIEKAKFPETYKNLPTDEKVAYWIEVLHRARRLAGEDGLDEEDAFSPELIVNMKKLDANIEALLPDVINGLAWITMSAPEDMLAVFNRRTGLSIRF